MAQATALFEWAQAEMTRNFRHIDGSGLQFAIVPIRTAALNASTESQSVASDDVVLLPMPWQGISPAKSDNTHFVRGRVNDFVQFGNVRIDFSAQEAIRGESLVALTSMEFKTLKFFVTHPYRVISRDELLNEVWGYDNYPCTRTVDNRILRLRQKLETDAANPRHFLTIYGAGYKFVP